MANGKHAFTTDKLYPQTIIKKSLFVFQIGEVFTLLKAFGKRTGAKNSHVVIPCSLLSTYTISTFQGISKVKLTVVI